MDFLNHVALKLHVVLQKIAGIFVPCICRQHKGLSEMVSLGCLRQKLCLSSESVGFALLTGNKRYQNRKVAGFFFIDVISAFVSCIREHATSGNAVQPFSSVSPSMVGGLVTCVLTVTWGINRLGLRTA